MKPYNIQIPLEVDPHGIPTNEWVRAMINQMSPRPEDTSEVFDDETIYNAATRVAQYIVVGYAARPAFYKVMKEWHDAMDAMLNGTGGMPELVEKT